MLYLLGAIVVLAILVVFVYNTLVKLRNKVDEAWSDIDTQLKRRYDLIPNLVETVKGYASHEAQTLEKVVQARTMAMGAKSLAEKEQAENMITGALKTIFALAEQYPDLKANQNFMELQTTLKEVEEHVQMSRRYYNGTVRDFNTQIQVFPNNIIAGPLGFKAREFFLATDEEKQNVKVSFSKEEKPSENTATASEAPTEPQKEPTEAPAPSPAQPEAPAEEKPEAPAPEAPQPPETPETPTEPPKEEPKQ